jgi:hypothetical protein
MKHLLLTQNFYITKINPVTCWLYENLKTSDSASVEINRRGRSRVIQYKIR